MNCLRKGKPLRKSPYWLRHRTRINCDYWVCEGQKLVSEVKRRESNRPMCGSQTWHRFDSKEAYQAEVARLKASGAKFI